MKQFAVVSLDASTWDRFAELVERHAGIFVDRRQHGPGIARRALEGALEQIATQGGGWVEAMSEVTAGRQEQGRFLFSGTVELLEDHGFERVRQVGKHAWIVRRRVLPD